MSAVSFYKIISHILAFRFFKFNRFPQNLYVFWKSRDGTGLLCENSKCRQRGWQINLFYVLCLCFMFMFNVYELTSKRILSPMFVIQVRQAREMLVMARRQGLAPLQQVVRLNLLRAYCFFPMSFFSL